jgi:hypothetical protein
LALGQKSPATLIYSQPELWGLQSNLYQKLTLNNFTSSFDIMTIHTFFTKTICFFRGKKFFFLLLFKIYLIARGVEAPTQPVLVFDPVAKSLTVRAFLNYKWHFTGIGWLAYPQNGSRDRLWSLAQA